MGLMGLQYRVTAFTYRGNGFYLGWFIAGLYYVLIVSVLAAFVFRIVCP